MTRTTSAIALVMGRLAAAVPVLLGVTLLSFSLTVWLGPDPTWSQLGRNPSPQDIEQVRQSLGLDRPFVLRYADYLLDLARLDFGHALSGEPVGALLARTLPVSVLLLAPGVFIGLAFALALAVHAAWRPGGRIDRLCDGITAIGTSLSIVIVIVALQVVFGGVLEWFPARGWRTGSLGEYVRHVTVPSLALIIGGLGYNLRFFRTVVRDVLGEPAVRTARAYGFGIGRINRRFVLRAAAPPVLTRILASLPVIAISGSLVIERHFGIPGLGRATWDAVMRGDQAVLMAVISLSSITLVLALTLSDAGLRLLDPRARQP